MAISIQFLGHFKTKRNREAGPLSKYVVGLYFQNIMRIIIMYMLLFKSGSRKVCKLCKCLINIQIFPTFLKDIYFELYSAIK